MDRKKLLHIEVSVKPLCPTPFSKVKEYWQEFLGGNLDSPFTLKDGHEVDLSTLPGEIQQTCMKAYIVDDDNDEPSFLPRDSFMVHTFVLSEEEACTEELEPSGGDDEYVAASDSLTLPHLSLDNLWESLIFEPGMKRQLLDYAQSALIFSDKKVSSHIINWNRIILLHGYAVVGSISFVGATVMKAQLLVPFLLCRLPGTGKTSLCRALANKLAIRLNHRFPRSTLLEIHSHSLFSKWFSTSGKVSEQILYFVQNKA
jgi:hypothetical protein